MAEQPSPQSWRWPFVSLALLVGLFLTESLGYRVTQLEAGFGAFFVYGLLSFASIFITAKFAPSRRLPIAIECAILMAIFPTYRIVYSVYHLVLFKELAISILLSIGWTAGIIVGAIAAVFLVRRNWLANPEEKYPERGSTWARATGLILLPVAWVIGESMFLVFYEYSLNPP